MNPITFIHHAYHQKIDMYIMAMFIIIDDVRMENELTREIELSK